MLYPTWSAAVVAVWLCGAATFRSSSSSSSALVTAFTIPITTTGPFHFRTTCLRETTAGAAENSIESDSVAKAADQESSVLESFLLQEFSAFHALLNVNPGLWTTLDEAARATGGITLLAPNNEAFAALGSQKLQQLQDVRNLETVLKMGLYHVIATEAVSAARLRTEDWTIPAPPDGGPRPITVQGLVTLGGQVPVGRFQASKGNFLSNLFGSAGDDSNSSSSKMGDDVVIGPASRIVKSYKLAGGSIIVHEMDSFVSPELLWRYCDQLRIPGF
jgi:uncharacterized surface protein with fasciclin (FAS1) repeats